MIVVLDALAGGSLLVVGILGWRHFRTSAVFAIAAAGAWFVVPAVPFLALLHRPMLLYAILSLPRSRVRGVLPRALLAVAWAGILLPAALQPWVALTTAVLCVAVAGAKIPVDGRPALELAARRALFLLAGGLVLPVLERLVWPSYVEAGLPIATYLVAVSLCSAVMVRGILTWERQQTDVVIELSEMTPSAAVSELRGLADRETDSRRRRVFGSAIALLEDNARLQRDLAERIGEVRASRARLIGAAIDERQRLERVIGDGALRYLRELEHCLTSTVGCAEADPTVGSCLDEIAHTRADLEQLARGLHPRTLTERGLAVALEELSRRGPVAVDLCASPARFPEPVETAVWYACAEALANVWKHARATRARVEVVETEGSLVATIGDDGVGGASLSPGGGLSGLVDRLSALDGSLALASSEAGTRVTITVPLP